jgi:hypothetical protein
MLTWMRIEDARPIVATRILLTLALAAALSVSLASTSLALEPGVHVDPGSPAAKEYALPLGQARQTGSSHGGLFGAGIKHAPTSRSAASGSPSSRGYAPSGSQTGTGGVVRRQRSHQRQPANGLSRAHRRPVRIRAEAATGSLPTAVQSAARVRATSGGGSLLALIGGGVAVLVLGILGGTVLRGRRSSATAGS